MTTRTHAKDLSSEEPRPMDATIDGYAWIPRMIDKARAARAGTLGSYYRYPCPIDRTCLAKLGVDADTFADAATSADGDQDVIAGLQRQGAAPADEAWFDPIQLNAELHGNGS